jgi:hypothetical protein
MARVQGAVGKWMLGVAATGVGLFAFSEWMARDVGEVAAAAVIVMTVASVVSILRMRRSAFWLGFVLVGWGWLAISLGSSLGPDLPETGWIDAVRPPFRPAPKSGWSDDWLGMMEYTESDQLDRDAYRTAGHCLVSLRLACVCGVATRLAFAVDDREPAAWRAPDGSLFRPNTGDGRDSP